MKREELLKQIAGELDAANVYEEYQTLVNALDSEKIRVGVLGQENSGKTTFINALLETSIPTSNLPSGINYVISYGEENTETKEDKAVIMQSNNLWLKENNVNVLEINREIILDKITQVDLCNILVNCDACIYMLSAQAALSRTDMFILQNLSEIGIPTFLVLSRTELLCDEDYSQVLSFVKDNLNRFSNVQICDKRISLLTKQHSKEIQESVANLLSKTDVATTRLSFNDFYFGYALSKLYSKCQEKINACQEKQEEIEKHAVEKECKLNEKLTEWLKIETQLRQKTTDISDKLRVLLDNRKNDIIRRLSHDIDVCGDIKLFWEKDFPFRLEEMMKVEFQSGIQKVNQELIKTMQWLQDELLKQFRCRMSLTVGVVGDEIHNSTELTDIDIADTNKLKIITRIGTAATVIAAGALFATSGIGGIVMAASMVSGLGAEFFMRKQMNESKDKIKQHLPEIVSRAQIQLVTDFNQKVQNVTDELISNLHTLKSEWQENSQKEIEQEKAIAKYNFSSSKWDNIMDRINQLSLTILN